MSITIYGAGAIGGLVGACMARAGKDVLLVDKVPEHVQRPWSVRAYPDGRRHHRLCRLETRRRGDAGAGRDAGASPTRFRGLRHSVGWDASPELVNRESRGVLASTSTGPAPGC
jgi:2-polyprenyl-6-methoxyphenol hydroxylase-like FAD-dependent oxidoreductase